MTMMALGFAGVSAALSTNFYRKYRARLQVGGHVLQYSRIADYQGVPLALAFDYRCEEGDAWSRVKVDVNEIYHYGPDYFVRGFGVPDRKGQIFKWNRIANLTIRADGRSLGSVEALLGEAACKEVRPAVTA